MTTARQEGAAEALQIMPLIGVQAFELDADFCALGIAMRDILLQRRSQREFSSEPVPHYRLSRLLWAACGCNGPDEPLRTAPSVSGAHAVDIYVDMAAGLYLFDPVNMALLRRGDALLHAPGNPDRPVAPLALLYVMDETRMAGVPQEDRYWQAAMEAGFMAQNVNLLCAAEGMAACSAIPAERQALARAMPLAAGQKLLLQQFAGMPKDAAPRNPWM